MNLKNDEEPPNQKRIYKTDSVYAEFVEEMTGIQLQPFQKEMLYLIEGRKRQCFVASRQVGKTYLLAALAFALAITHENHMTLIVSTGESHAKEILDRVRTFFRKSRVPYHFEKDSQDEIRVAETGSRIVSRPSNPRTVRGYSPDCLIIDEVASIEHWDEMQASLFPSVGQTDGIIILSSTFKGKNHFYEMTQQEDLWNTQVYPWWVHPHPEIELLRKSLPPERFAEEFECVPLDEAWSLFPYELIELCTVDELEEWVA